MKKKIKSLNSVNTVASLKLQKENIKYSHKYFSDYLSIESSSTLFLQPTDKEEIGNIISSLNSDKAFRQIVYLIEYYFF